MRVSSRNKLRLLGLLSVCIYGVNFGSVWNPSYFPSKHRFLPDPTISFNCFLSSGSGARRASKNGRWENSGPRNPTLCFPLPLVSRPCGAISFQRHLSLYLGWEGAGRRDKSLSLPIGGQAPCSATRSGDLSLYKPKRSSYDLSYRCPDSFPNSIPGGAAFPCSLKGRGPCR